MVGHKLGEFSPTRSFFWSYTSWQKSKTSRGY
jgi:ribosomal protein S19